MSSRGIGDGGIRSALDWWESGGRPGPDKGVNHWSGLVQTLLTEFRAELNRSLSADRRFLAGAELDWYLRNLDGILTYTEAHRLADPFEVLVRRVALSGTLGGFGIVPAPESPFGADRLFRLISAEITDERLTKAKRLGPVWCNVDRVTVSRLLRLKHLFTLAAMVQPRLTNDSDVEKVDSWRPVYELLPVAGSENVMPDHRSACPPRSGPSEETCGSASRMVSTTWSGASHDRRVGMAHQVRLYCALGENDAAGGLDALVAAAREQGSDLRPGERESGGSWVSAILDRAGEPVGASGCHIEIHAQSPLASAMIAEVAEAEPSGRIRSANAVVTLTLTGSDVDWSVVRAVWKAAKSLWNAVPYDDGSGFDIDLDEL
ncbi:MULTISPECIES: hypothetical protein [Amycolatopsis]|uniref:hypothetical protein n=1 Tax=Amycolatopsis TaxID=1813 RepID=UPI0011777D8D|nr:MULTISPECIES: hypothetical protein [Amycolatopsis]